jgi:hypothetical protein
VAADWETLPRIFAARGFVARHGFGRAQAYPLILDDKSYDSPMRTLRVRSRLSYTRANLAEIHTAWQPDP